MNDKMSDKMKTALANAGLDQWHSMMRDERMCFGIFVYLFEVLTQKLGDGSEFEKEIDLTLQRGELLMIVLAVQSYIENNYIEGKNEK